MKTAPPDRSGSRSRLRLGLVLAVIAGGLAFLVVQGLGNATTYFRNADEAVAERDDLGTKRFRLQGTVVGDAVVQGEEVVFTVEYNCEPVDVVHAGDPPELFKPGIPVVLEGAFTEADAAFHSDRMMVRHTSEYREENAENLDQAAANASADAGCRT